MSLPRGVELVVGRGQPAMGQGEEVAAILTPDALEFVAQLQREFRARRRALLDLRRERQAAFDAGARPDFLEETRDLREGSWSVAPIPKDLTDRRVEITGPPERKMVINALNSGARVFMADFEDANSPTWSNNLTGQLNLRDAVAGTIRYQRPDGKSYRLSSNVATLMVRPRGWHLPEKHLLVDDEPISGSLFDFGLFLFHNGRVLLDKGSGPYFYLPKLESHHEARLWNDVFLMAQDLLGLPRGSIRATVLIETITAVFEMHEILYELREHSAGLNCGRWDYIFNFIKRFRSRPECVLPDRAQVTMTTHFLRSYSLLAIQTCHRRGAHAIGGMAAQIPIKDNPDENERALEKVRADKVRESRDGHDGTWVAHPGLVPIALEIFNAHMPGPHQLHVTRDDVQVTRSDLLQVPQGTITEAGLRHNIDVGIQYLEAWLSGNGCVPIYNLMEDAATSEICRTQVWQWAHHPSALDDGRPITLELCRSLARQELESIRALVGEEKFAAGHFQRAAELFQSLVTRPELEEFLTLVAYPYLE